MNESEKSSAGRASRALIFLLAGLTAALAIWGGYHYWRSSQYRRVVESGYRRAVQEAAVSLSNISTDLVKGMYSGTPAQLSQVSAKLWKEASGAKSAISVLPLAQLHLDKTNQFLSQVGDYAMYLSRTSLSGEAPSFEEQENFRKLREYAERLSDAIDELDDELERGEITVAEIQSLLERGVDTDDIDETLPTVVTDTSLDAMEGGFSGYPTLIYDGPFSDHILNRKPNINSSALVDVDTARSIAQRAVGNTTELPYQRDESSNLPGWVFYGDDCSVAVSKHGGRLCYLLRSKPDDIEERMTAQDAVSAARNYLNQQGYSNMKESYYEIDDGIITINFAQSEGDVLCYTDLIKVAVSMEDGTILSCDARGWLVNHKERNLPAPTLSAEDAAKALSTQLTRQGSRLALIPTLGEDEVLCWEFDCEGSAGDHVLVYVNTQNGNEEQILLLIEDEDGTLTK